MIKTRLTKLFNIEHPILSAPMALAAGGKLAAAVSNAGGLGFIGGAYGDGDWIEREFDAAGNAPVGCGFITWNLVNALKQYPDMLDKVLERKPSALFLSFGNPEIFAKRIQAADIPLICQVQTMSDAKHAIDVGANIIVAQGGEAGGHGETRGTMAFVPEVADWIANRAPDVLLLAAGGIGDGRGLAASLLLGADGVLIGSRLWASEEALVHPNMLSAAISSTGDDTIRSNVMDIARQLDWPDRYTARVLKNAFTEQWHNDINGLLELAESESMRWKQAWLDGDETTANTFVGEATGLIGSIESAADIINDMVSMADQRLKTFA